MSRNNLKRKKKIEILIIGGCSKIARETFKLNNEFEVTGFSRYSKTKKIPEYKLIKYKNIQSIKKYLLKKKDSRIVILFMEAFTNSKILLNKSSKELLGDLKYNLLNFHDKKKLELPQR